MECSCVVGEGCNGCGVERDRDWVADGGWFCMKVGVYRHGGKVEVRKLLELLSCILELCFHFWYAFINTVTWNSQYLVEMFMVYMRTTFFVFSSIHG